MNKDKRRREKIRVGPSWRAEGVIFGRCQFNYRGWVGRVGVPTLGLPRTQRSLLGSEGVWLAATAHLLYLSLCVSVCVCGLKRQRQSVWVHERFDTCHVTPTHTHRAVVWLMAVWHPPLLHFQVQWEQHLSEVICGERRQNVAVNVQEKLSINRAPDLSTSMVMMTERGGGILRLTLTVKLAMIH